MANKQQLISKLQQFTRNYKQIKRLIDRFEYQKLVSQNGRIIQIIEAIFGQIYSGHQNDVSTDKLRKEFMALLGGYQGHLRKYQEEEQREVNQMRRTYTELRASMHQQRLRESGGDEESGREMDVEMIEVNQETLHYQRMIEIKEKEIQTIKERMQGALQVQQDLKNMVFEQGDMLDQAQNNINDGHKNVLDAHENLIEARQQHMSSKKKQCCIFFIVLAVLLAIIIPILIKFT